MMFILMMVMNLATNLARTIMREEEIVKKIKKTQTRKGTGAKTTTEPAAKKQTNKKKKGKTTKKEL